MEGAKVAELVTASKVVDRGDKDGKDGGKDDANWEDTDQDLFKPEVTQPSKPVEEKSKEPQEIKSASNISFGTGVPRFGGGSGPPKFGGKKEKIVNAEEFPEIGGEVLAKKGGDDKNSSSSGPPKFKSNKTSNMFSGFNEVGAMNKDSPKNSKPAYKEKVPYEKPREKKVYKTKDEFFGNFRDGNKREVPDPPKKEEKDTDIAFNSSGPPKFSFTNAKKDAMTMAKAQEIALKKKEEEDKNKEKEEKEKPKEIEKKKFVKDEWKKDKGN